ncbi:MAG: 2,3,4,5-tetrahydropyridine-2,6-dicarboxylate N-succinyltransferase [Holosporales bacterium]|jgi:2,3,4,5-tetrahydropyridine-2-carboxylate N-succinyltransferase|nr:2,3,4,5-tetrahydropyridine-2,6-dicarboxylate N-succinyltransferase [Holosporales bacterium]
MISNLKDRIEEFSGLLQSGNTPDSGINRAEILRHVDEVFALLNKGEIRVAEKTDGRWVTHSWIKKAILLAFKFKESTKQAFDSFDKLGLLEFNHIVPRYRKVCPAVIRDGVYIGNDVVVMPSYINTGAYIGDNTMIDINAVVGSCAQIGCGCHISAQSCVGGVLEPVVDNPVIIEDNCFIGVHSSILEGVIVEENSIIAAGVNITASTKIIDRATGEVLLGRVPGGSVIVPGSYPSGGLSIACCIIVRTVNSKARSKVKINEILRHCAR